MKEFFSFAAQFYEKIFCSAQREGTQAQKKDDDIHPKIPQRTQRRAERAEIENRAEECPQHQIKPQFPLRQTHRIPDHTHRHRKAERQIAQQ